jgi:phosphoribosylanthranilate isomerase
VNVRRAPRVKVCCIASLEEARWAVAAGADAIGLVSEMPSGPGVISEETIAEIARAVPPTLATFLLTSRVSVEAIVEQLRRCRTTTVQLCDRLERGSHLELRAAVPEIAIVQVIHVSGREALDEAVVVAPHVDALLLDSGNCGSTVKELGGTGRTHDWAISAEIRRSVRIPVFLAGGLNASNVSQALDQVEPWGVDLCTGVRSEGKLDRDKLQQFFRACGRAPLPSTPPELSAGSRRV